jgi:hypothetical protein
VPVCAPEAPGFPESDGVWLPCEPPLSPGCGSDAVDPLGLDDEELEVDPPLLDGDDVGGGAPLGDPDEPELPLGGELGTGMLLGLGWVMTVCDRQPVSSSEPRAAVAVKRLWPAPVVMNRLPKLAHRGALSCPAALPTRI